MWKVTIEAKGYNRINFKFESLVDASSFIETAQNHCDENLDIRIVKFSVSLKDGKIFATVDDVEYKKEKQ